MLIGSIAFGSSFRVRIIDGMALTNCRVCKWSRPYELEVVEAASGLFTDRRRALTDAEIDHKQRITALELAAEEHKDHARAPQLATI